MIKFTATIQKFGQQGEKTGWTYIMVPEQIAQKLNPGNKKSFRVKGSLDQYKIEGTSLIPMGGGDYIMALNAAMRKNIAKPTGALLNVEIMVDTKPQAILPEFLECLADDPPALEHFNTMPNSHQNYFSKWIESAKTEATKTKRIAMAVNALSRGWDYSQMMRAAKKEKEDIPGL